MLISDSGKGYLPKFVGRDLLHQVGQVNN
jgi:hypothetical protein